jgi:hypothetical protein
VIAGGITLLAAALSYLAQRTTKRVAAEAG